MIRNVDLTVKAIWSEKDFRPRAKPARAAALKSASLDFCLVRATSGGRRPLQSQIVSIASVKAFSTESNAKAGLVTSVLWATIVRSSRERGEEYDRGGKSRDSSLKGEDCRSWQTTRTIDETIDETGRPEKMAMKVTIVEVAHLAKIETFQVIVTPEVIPSPPL